MLINNLNLLKKLANKLDEYFNIDQIPQQIQ